MFIRQEVNLKNKNLNLFNRNRGREGVGGISQVVFQDR